MRLGLGWWYSKYAPGDTEFAWLEVDVRSAKRVLWSQPNPIPPWDWRHGRGMPVTAAVIGNRNSHVYHAPHCRAAAVMNAENRVSFNTAAEAKTQGYREAKDCR